MESLSSTGSSAATAPPTARPHVVLFASPGAGHLLPLAELAPRIVEHHGFEATLVTFAGAQDDALLPSCLPASVATATLPAVGTDDLPVDALHSSVLTELIRRSLPNLRALLRSISSAVPLAAVVPDFFFSVALPVAAELGVPGYLFVPSNLTMMALTHRLVQPHDGAAPGEYHDLPVPLELPGGVSLRRADLPGGFRDCNGLAYKQILESGRRYRRADGLLVNTFYEMEPATVEAFKVVVEHGAFPPVFPMGPFVRSSSDEAGASPCLEWLDRQPPCSVVYISFGSGGALSVEQTAELAAGLEASGHRFLWVVRTPSMDGRAYAFGTGRDDDDDPLTWLPEGFLERTKGRGLAVAAWAPQVRVLSHPATAAFVAHCGWNSALESVGSGVPMVAWPLYAEQRMNAAILEAEDVGVALAVRPRARAREEDGVVVVTREDVAAAVKEMMEGEKGRAARRRAGDLQQAAARAWSPEGSSCRAMEEVAGRWKAALGRER